MLRAEEARDAAVVPAELRDDVGNRAADPRVAIGEVVSLQGDVGQIRRCAIVEQVAAAQQAGSNWRRSALICANSALIFAGPATERSSRRCLAGALAPVSSPVSVISCGEALSASCIALSIRAVRRGPSAVCAAAGEAARAAAPASRRSRRFSIGDVPEMSAAAGPARGGAVEAWRAVSRRRSRRRRCGRRRRRSAGSCGRRRWRGRRSPSRPCRSGPGARRRRPAKRRS